MKSLLAWGNPILLAVMAGAAGTRFVDFLSRGGWKFMDLMGLGFFVLFGLGLAIAQQCSLAGAEACRNVREKKKAYEQS